MIVEATAGEAVSESDAREVRILVARPELTVTWSRYEAGERGPGPHVHHAHADAFYVLEGTLRFEVGPRLEPLEAPERTLVLVPPDVVHTFANPGPETATYLNVHAPDEGFAESLRARRDGRERREPFDSHDPPADGGRPAAEVVVRRPGEGAAVGAGANRVLFKAEAHDGIGSFSLTETTAAPGFPGPVLHRHEAMVDCFFALDGALALRLGGEERELAPGTFAAAPPRTPHTFANPGEEPVRFLNLMAPGGLEQYLKEVAAATPREAPPDPAVMAALASRYDFHPVG